MPEHWKPGQRSSSQHWMTFVRNHAKAMLASDFFMVVTARFQILYMFVVMEVGSRKIAHCNVTSHPTADWTLQQFREVITGEQPYRFPIHDRDSIYSPGLNSALKSMGLTVLKTPVRAPQANAFCEQLIRTIRRECLDFLVALSEKHLRRILREWIAHYNTRTTAFESGARYSRSSCERAFDAMFGPSHPRQLPSGGTAYSWRSSSRVPTGESSSVREKPPSTFYVDQRTDFLRSTAQPPGNFVHLQAILDRV
jgi:hypothetical protein